MNISGHDTSHHRTSVSQLPEDEAIKLLEGIRERRLRAFKIYQETQKQKQEARSKTVTVMLDKQLVLLSKDIAALDKLITKVDERVNKVRALRLELEDL